MSVDEVIRSGISPANTHPRGYVQFDPISGAERVRINEELEQITKQVDSNTIVIGRAAIGSATSADVWQLQRISQVGDESQVDWPEDVVTGLPTREYCFAFDDFDTGIFPVVAGSAPGETLQFAANITGAVLVPAVAGNDISKLKVKAPDDQPANRRIEYSFDGFTVFHILAPGEMFEWCPIGVAQVDVRGQGGLSTDYEITINRPV